MTAKEYLGQAYRMDREINSKLEQIESLRSLTQKVTVSYGSEAVSRTRNVHSLEDTIVKLIEAENSLCEEIDHLIEIRMEIAATIALVRNSNYRLVLEKRYLAFLEWGQIAVDMDYSIRWLHTVHDRALDVVEKLLEKKERAV